MMRQNQNSIVFLINNGGYTIEVEIHDGPYNVIKNWNYVAMIQAIHNGEGNVWATKVMFSCINLRITLLFTSKNHNKLHLECYLKLCSNF